MGLFDAFSTGPANAAAGKQTDALKYGYSDLAAPLYQAGRTDLTTNFGQAGDAFKNLQQGTQAGSNAYGDATGANGPEGLARAKALFTQTPGYVEGLNQSLDQNDRRTASRGMLGSGNTIADTTKLATDYANQKFGDYASKLQPYLGANAGAVAGQAGVAQGLGTALNTNETGQGQLGFNAAAGVGNAQAQAELAKYQTSGNFINALLKAGGFATSVAGGFGGAAAGGGGPMGWAPSPNGPDTVSPMYG